jgi:hypothetical protein
MLDAVWNKQTVLVITKERKEVSARVAEFQAINAGTNGDKNVQYLQKTHWAFLDLFTCLFLRADSATVLMQALEQRIFDLEEAATDRTKMAYRGVFSDTEHYEPGDMTTFAGSLWHCNQATKEKPGEAGSAWTLCCKKGRDGKDFRP